MQFLNVDLEIKSRSSLAPLLEALGENVIVLYHDPTPRAHFANLEVSRNLPWPKSTPDKVITTFCNHLEKLPSEARRAWNRAHLKTFDVGIDTEGHRNSCITISRDSARRIAALGASVTFTAYGQMAQKLELSLTVVVQMAREGGFTSRFAELPEVFSEGETIHAARENLFDALKEIMEARRAQAKKTKRNAIIREQIRLVAA